MVRETNNVCFGQIAQETQVVVREDNKRDHLKRSTEDVSPPNFSERNSGYYERNSRLVTETDSYLRRSNNNSYQSSSSSSNTNNNNSSSSSSSNNNNNSSSNNPDNRSRTRDKLYRNGPNAVGVSTTTSGSSAATLLSERTSSGASSNKINNSRVPPTSWYEAAATYTNGPGGSGNADVSAAKINHYQTAASTELQTTTAAATTNSTTTSSYTAYSYASSPAHNNNNNNQNHNTATGTTTTSSSSRNSTFYGKDTDKDSEANLSTTPPLLNKNKQKLLKSSSLRSGSSSPTASSTTTTFIGGVSGAGLATMTSSSSTAASASSSASSSSLSSTSNNNINSRSNQTANNSCSSVSSTINSSNTNTNNNNSLSGNSSSVTSTDNTHSGSGSGNVSGILNAAALAAAASKGGSSSNEGHKNHNSSGGIANSSSNATASGNTSSNNPSTSASHHTSRSAAHAHFHGRSTTSSSRSHSRSPSSYSSSHSSSSSSSSTASSHSHASSPVGGRDVETSSITHVSSSRSGSRSLQSAVAVPGTSSSGLNHPSGSNVCGSSSSSTSSTSSGTPTGNPVVHSEDNRPLAIRVRNLPARSSDTSLKDGLFHEYKKHGKVTWVKVVGQNAERYALVCFKKPEDVEKALEVSHDKLFFGCKIEVEPYQGYDVEDNEFRPYEAELDEYHPKSTRTLFIGNLEKEITSNELRQHFECFGEIIEIDIKKQGMSAYAFCQYSDIVSVVKAMRKMDGEHLGNNRIKLGFGKSMPTNCVWIDGIGEKISESHLQSQFSRYGAVSKVVVDRQRQLALVLYEQIQYAQTAVKEMRGATLRGRKLQVDFASRECQDAFYEKLEKQSAGSRFNRYESQSRSRASSFSRHQNSNDGCSPGNTPGSSSSSSAGVPSSAPALSSAIVTGSSALSNTASCNTLASVVGQASGNTTPARSRGSRSSRHTMDYEYLDTRRFRSCDEYSQGSATSHDEDNSAVNHPSTNTNSYSGIGLRSDSPLLSRLGPIVNTSGKESSSEMLELALSRRRCDKSPKGDIRLFQKERAVLLEQLEECPSSGDESIVSPRKRIKIDHHSINSSSGLTQSHSMDEQQPQHKNSNCDYLLNDPMHRKSEVRRLSECNSSLNKYPTPQQNHHHSHHAVPPPPPHHHHHQQQLSRRPSIDFMATSGGVAGGISSLSTRHNSTSSSNSDHHPPPHQSSSSSSSLACKRRRVIGSSSNAIVTSSSLLSGSTGGNSNLSSFGNDDCHHHTSRGRGHQLHSHHSHEASGGESADGSRPGTPLCDERPEVLPSEPRRVPRERPREPMVLPLPKFGIQFFHQYRNSIAAGNTPIYHHMGGSFTSSSAAGGMGGSNNSGSSHLLSNSILNRGEEGISNSSHSSLSHSTATITPASTAPTGTSSSGCYLPSPSTRYTPHWRPHHHQHHHHNQQHGGSHHGPSGGATPSSSSSMVSPMRSRSLSSNSSDSDVPGQSSTGSPSLEERIRTLDEMYERWSGGGTSSSNIAIGSNVVKRHDFNHTPPTWQHHRSNSQSDSHHSSNSDVRSNATPSTPASRPKFLDIDVNEMQPSDIVKSVLAKKSIFDDDLQRLKKNHWYEPSTDSSQLTKAIMGVCTSPGLPNLQATKTPVVGCTTSITGSGTVSSLNKPSGALLQRLSSLSPMNSPQASMSPYNSPSPSPSVTLSSVALVSNTTMTKVLGISSSGGGNPGSQTPSATSALSTSPAASGGTKCLQYPFPTHPPLPNTAAPVQSAQPIPPPPAESSKPCIAQPPLPPMEVLQPPQPPATSPTSSAMTSGSSTKPKTSALSKSLSVPPPTPSTATAESRIFTKSVSVPGSTNLGTVKSTADTSAVSLTAAPHLEQNQPQQTTTGSSSLHPSKSHKEDTIVKPPSHTSSSSASTSDNAVKRGEKSHKHNHRSSEDKKSSKNDRRKNSNSSQTHLSQASAAESSDADEHDSKKERKERQERQERREKELRKQQEREEREEREREEREREEKERLERERLEAERLEKERLEKERLERERLEKEERERVQREKERLRKEEEQRAKEERERKEKEEKERKLIEQREREENERREREEAERREREEREEQLRKERKEREELEQKEKEKLERQRMREEKERERKTQEEANTENKRDINLLKEHQRRKENAASQNQAKTGNDMGNATSQSAHEFFRQGETERQNNKENSTEESPALDTASASSKHKNRKTSRNTSPVRHPKRRLSSQDSNASNSAASTAYAHTDDHAKRMRIDLQTNASQNQPTVNNHNAVNNTINERRDSKEHHAKERSNKHTRVTSSTHKPGNIANQTNEKEHNTKHHRNKHHHKAQATSQGTSESNDVNLSKLETEHVTSNCMSKTEDEQQNTDHDMELKPKIPPLLSSDEEEVSETPSTATQHHNKNVSSNHKHREHGSGHHSRHKSNKREREHHREKKRHSLSAGTPNSANANELVPSTPPSANCNVTDEETIPSATNQLAHRRSSGHGTGFDINAKSKHDVSDRKMSRCSEDSSGIHPQTPTHRQNNLNKSTPQSSSRRVLLSSAEDTDGGGGGVAGMGADDDDDSDNRQHSIFDIPDDGPYVSMYDKVKARSCKNMQKQEEEKKIKAKFSQLKQSRAKREEKKRSTSYDGDSDSDFDGASSEHQKQHNRSGGSYKMLSGGLSSTDDEHDMEAGGKTPSRERRRSSQASSSANSMHPNRVCSDSDDNSVTQRRLKLQDNLRRLCDDGDDTSEDDLIRRHNSGLANKRLLHHTSRIASDSESQSQSAVDIKLKQEPLETSNDGTTTPVLKHLKQRIKKEVDAMEASGETADFNEFKFKSLSSMCSSADEQSNIKSESTGELLSANEIKKESKDYYADEYLQSEQKFNKSPMASASQHCSPEQAKIKKHKKSKKRQKTPTQDSVAKEHILEDNLVKHTPQATNAAFLTISNDTKNSKLLTSPCYDAFDELKRGDTLVTLTSPDLQITAEKKRHKERKEKKREKLRHMSADVGSGVELDKMIYEKEKHRLKKSKKSKSLDVMRQTSTTTQSVGSTVSAQEQLLSTVPAACTPQHKQRSGGEKMEDIFGPISDEDDEDLSDSDIGARDLNCITNRNNSSSNMPGPIVSAALNPYKQEPLTPKSHTVEENEENKQKLTCNTLIGASAHLERVAERQHRKEKREKKRKEREKSRSSEQNQSIGFMPSPAVSTAKPMEDENSVDLDAAGRALEAQLMEDSDNKTVEDATPSTANTYRSDITDVFLFSDCDENSLEMSSTNKHEKKEIEKEHTTSVGCKNKEKKKKKKRSKEEKQLHHQRRESSSSNASQLASTMVAPSTSTTTKLTIDVQAATKHAQKSTEEHLPSSSSPLCKPSPSLPCLIGDDDDDLNALQGTKSTPNTSLTNVTSSVCTTPHRSSSKDMLTLSPHMKDKQMISPIPKTPTINSNSCLNTSENLNKVEVTTPSTPTSSMMGSADNANTNLITTPTSSTAAAAKILNKSNDSSASSNIMDSPSSSLHTTQQKKKPEIFIPGFDGEIDERISESAVQSISAEFNPPLDPMADEPKIPVESPPDASKLEKLEESKSRVTISQEETESAVSALLGESFGNSSADYSFNDDDDGLDDLNNAITDPEPVMAPGEPDEEAALAAKAIECEVASSAITDTVEEDTEEVCKAIQSLRQEELDIKADTPQSVRDLQIDTDTEENVDEADSSGSHSLKIDETAQSNNSSTASDKANTTANQTVDEPAQPSTTETEVKTEPKSSVITKVESPIKTQPNNNSTNEPKIEPPTISKQDQPAVQPVQAVMSPAALEVSVASTVSTSTVVSSSSMSTSINTTTLAGGVSMSYTSTPIKTSITFAPTSTSSSTPKQTHLLTGKSITSSTSPAGYVMQPPTITIPEPSTHFVVPQLVLSPRGVVTTAHHNDSSSSSSASMHSPSGHHMPPQSPVGATYIMGVRAQSPHSPRQHTSRGNTPTPRQPSPHTPTPTPPPIAVTPQHQQQQHLLIQRTVQQHQQNLMSPPSQGHVSQNNSPLASPTLQQRQIAQGVAIHKVTPQQQQPSPNTPDQHMIKINNYSTPPSQTLNMVNIRIPPASPQQQHGQQPSPQQMSHSKSVIDQQQQHVPMGQHILPISVQKMPPVPTHPTIISKVVTVTPQQAQQSMMQSSPGGNLYSPSSTSGSGANQSRQTSQVLQQIGGKTLHQQQSSQIQFMQQQQQRQQQQQHMMQMQQQQIMHQQQKLPQQQQTSMLSQPQTQQQQQHHQQQQQQSQHNFVVSQQRNLPSPQQMQQQQSQNTQQLKVQYQQHQMLAPSQQSPTQQQPQQTANVIQNSTLPQRFLVQQHIVGLSPQQQQQHSSSHQQSQANSSPNQLHNSSTQQQKPNAIFGKHQQQQQQQHHLLQQRQQSPSPHRMLQQQPEIIKESSRVIMSTNQSVQQTEPLAMTPTVSKPNVDKQSCSPTTSTAQGNKPTEVVSVIRTPTPTTTATSPIISTLTPNTTMASNKESATTTAATNTSRSVPLTEENVIKISPPKHDEIEQDSKEDSDYWSAKELNMVEANNTSNSNANVVSTVIKKNESITSTETSLSTSASSIQPSNTKEQETKSFQTQLNKVDNKPSTHQQAKSDVGTVTAAESQGNSTANIVTTTNTTSYSQSQSGNVTTDHDTEDETETQQMPAFEQVPIQGRPSTRGTGAKRGRQPRGGKKAAAANISNTPINTNVNTQQLQTELGAAAGVQTRLRKPNTATPATRGRKGRPPRNLLLQQQQLQQQHQHHEQPTPTSQTSSPISIPSTTLSNVPLVTTAPVLTAAEKKARSQAAAAAAALASLSENNQQQQQDVYEFHDESGDEAKTTTTAALSTTTTTSTTSTISSDHRPRLILTIKSPAPGSTPLVKASEKAVNIEPTTVKPLNESTTAQQSSGLSENLPNITQSAIQPANQSTEPTVAELAAAANTRKSRRLLEKDRSTIDDIIEDVVRNTATNAAGGNAIALAATATNVLANTLPKGAQTPPRRSGRNSGQSKPTKPVEATQTTSAHPTGRPRKSKDRKNTNELDNEQTPSPQPKHLVHDISDVEDAKSVNTPPPADVINVQPTPQQQTQSTQVATGNMSSLQQPLTPQQTTITSAPSASIPQHPKKKALAAAEIESYQSSNTTTTATTTPNIHSALPAGGVPMLNTAAPATQKTTGGAADSVNKPLIDPVTGVVSGLQMQQAKEGNLPSATAASQPLRGPMDPKKMMQAAAAAAAAESNALNSKLQNTSATQITALTKHQQQQVEGAAVTQVPASTVATAMLNKSVSVVVKTSTLSPTQTPPPPNIGIQQHLQQSQQQQQQQQQHIQQQRQDIGTPQKQPIIMHQQTSSVMHAQHTNVRPPTTLKAHVLNSQKLQQQQTSHQQYMQQQQQHQILQQQPTTTQSSGSGAHVIQNTIVQRPSLATANQQQQQLPPANKQLLVNIPTSAATHALNSPRHIPQHTQQQPPQTLSSSQQSLVIKQAHDMHTPQVLHVVSSKTSAPTTQTNKPLQSASTLHQHQPPNASPHPSYTTYIQTPTVGVHSKQQQQLPQKPVVIHQQTIGVPQKSSTTPLVMPPGILGLPPHSAMVIQTKTSAPAQSPSSSTSPATPAAAHLQHANQHTPSPPLQPPPPQHLVKSSSNPMIHSLQAQGVSHVLNTVASPSPPSAVKPNTQQSQSIATNVGASSLRTAIPTISPQSQARIGSILLPGGMQVPPHFETSMHDIANYGSAVAGSVRTTQSPPPAHQQASPITPSEASFPGGIGRVGVPTREHLMIYQQLLRQHDPLNPAALREYDEKLLGSSPPLELRRPGSVPRTVAVPHSLQSPQDRATDSPQVAQVYVHNTRIPAHTHYDVTGRAGVAAQPSPYYDASRQISLEPPPAHRSAPVHSVVAPPPTVVVPHPTAGSSSPFMPAAPPATAVQPTPSSVPPTHHTKLLEREREQREREREQQLLREKEQIMVRAGADAHNMQVATPPPPSHQLPPHGQQPPPPPQADSLLTLLQRYPVMWQGLLALKTDQAAVQMHFVFGNPHVARASLPCNSDGSTPPLRIAQRMRLEQTQLEGVAKKMQFENEHCMLLALPCGRDHADVLQQSRNLQSGFITYLQQKMAAGIVNIPMPGSEQAAYVVHIFPSCDFANENLEKAAPDLKNRVADIAHLLIVIATV
ncbi:protein split ends isoform X1 [Lucilia cuprina]|uniref:protein split ends isoform X1 n=1 Tax=Lucilia cuprina TaxID=7375 RepID=UPI001F056DA2|nr:protein split ends isoform X1 [Lucilia cuprina]